MKFSLYTSMQRFPCQTLRLASLLALLMLVVSTSEASIRATLDRDTAYAGDTFTLTIEGDGLQSGLQPDLTPLEKDFDLLGTSTSTQVSIMNGQRSEKTLWQVQLQARHTGRLRIPSLNVGGKQTTALELEITETPEQASIQASQHVFVKTEINSVGKQTYVQQQIPYTVRLYYDESVLEGELSPPKPDNAVVEQLGEDINYNTVSNGHRYNVIERHYVISPEKSGSLHIPPTTFNGRIAVQEQRKRNSQSGSLMDDFFSNSSFANDPFFRNSLFSNSFFGSAPFANPGQAITAHSQSVDMDIRPRPASAGRNWLPAEAVSVSDSWSDQPPQFKAGEPVSRTITIQTRGLSGSQIPELAIAAPANARLYPETQDQESRTDGETIYGIRTQTMTYIPDTQGMLEVPAITLDWWNTRQNKAASTSLPALQFKVLPGAPGTANHAPTPKLAAQQGTPTTVTTEATPSELGPDMSETLSEAIRKIWIWPVTGISLLLALLAVMIGRRTIRRRQAIHPGAKKPMSQSTYRAKPNQNTALRALEKACLANDRHAAVNALLSLGQAYWPDEPPRSLDALAAHIENGRAQLRELDHSLYAANIKHWNGKHLWNEFRHGLQQKERPGHTQDDGLHPLYPQHS